MLMLFSSIKLQTSLGISPDKLFEYRPKYFNFFRLAISFGISPFSKLKPSSMEFKFVNLPISTGICPFKSDENLLTDFVSLIL